MVMSDKGPGQEHVKANYIEIIKRVIPDYYDETEYNLYGEEEDLQYRVLGSILYAANNLSSLIGQPSSNSLTVSSFSATDYYVPFFVPFNGLTDVTPATFELNVLVPLGKRFSSFTNRAQFQAFLLTSALPCTRFNKVTTTFASGFSSLVDPAASSVSAVQNKLIDELGFVHFLNTSGKIVDDNSVAPSSFLYSAIGTNLYDGKRFQTEQGVAELFKWMYYNGKGGGDEWSDIRASFLPAPFATPSSTYTTSAGYPGNYYASGGQLVSALETLVNVWVNEDDPTSLYFRDIVNASLLGMEVRRMENAGPMGKMLKALAYGFYDVKTSVRDIQFLLDIDECPDEFLQYLGRYVGWTFFGDNPDQWRDQLKQAIYLYKAKGTRQALANAVNMIIPSSVYTPNDKVYGLQELWESYYPNILYYALKTETSLGVGTKTYLDWKNGFSRAMAASGIPVAVLNYNAQDPDTNVRFCVDAALEYLNTQFNYLDIGGIPYQDTAYIRSQDIQRPPEQEDSSGGAPKYLRRGPGYSYRGAELFIPPWEEPRFYQNAALGPNMDEFARETSAMLSRSFVDGGFGMSSTTANSVAAYILSAVGIKGGDGFAEPGWGANNNFKFFTSSLQLPFNYQDILARGDLESMSIFDYWNGKSSEVHSKFHGSSIDFEANDFLDIAKTKIGRKGIPTIVNIFRQFSPFHALNKIFVGSGIYDSYAGTRNGPEGSDNAELPWSGIMDIEVVNTIQSDMDQVMSTYTSSGFPGAWGAFGTFSGVGVWPSVWDPQGGRFLPSATLVGVRGTGPDGYFWSGGGSGTQAGPIQPAPEGTKQLTSLRTAGRRRNLKYKFTGWAQNREGINQPIATDWFGVSGEALQPVLERQGLHIPAFVPKGFSFSSQDFVATSGSTSSVYSYYNTSSTPFYQFNASSFFPARAIPDFIPNASSFNQLRDVFGSQILRAISDTLIRRGKRDSRWLQFSDQGFRNFKFGRGLTNLYQEYNNTFRRQLQNWIDQNTQIGGDRYAGGFNIIAHVFGPLFFNHALNIKGHVVRNLGQPAFSELYSQSVSASNPDWSGVASTEANIDNPSYVNTKGKQVLLSRGVLQSGARGTYINTLDTFEKPSVLLYSNNTLLSGIELVSPTVNSIAVWNNKDSSALNIDSISPNGLTFLQRNSTDSQYQGIRVRLPLNGNINYSYNGKFKFPPLDSALNSMATSAIAGWALYDKNRTPRVNQLGSITYNNTSSLFVKTSSSGLPWVKLNGKGCASGTGVLGVVSGVLGSKAHASLVSVTDVEERQTPANLRHLTPGHTYKISLEASGSNAANYSRLTYALINQTTDKVWVEPLGAWRDGAASIIDNYANVMTSATVDPKSDQKGDEWKTFTGEIVTSSIFQQGDNYQLWITPANRTAGNTVKYNIRNVNVAARDASGTSNITAGAVGNKIFKEEDYTLGVTARVARIPFGDTVRNEVLYVRIVTDQKPFVGNGWEDFAKNWYYNWDKKFWETVEGATLDDQWMPLLVSATAPDGSALRTPTRFELDFATRNRRTPLRYFSLSKDGPMNGYFASAGPVHDEETVYYIEIAKPHTTGEFTGATLLGVDMVNKRYNVYAGDYTKKDFADVFDFFDTLSNNKSSRDARDSSGTYLLSGGGRSEGLEYWGGSHSATNGVYGFREND